MKDLGVYDCIRCGRYEADGECLAIMQDNASPTGLLNTDEKKAAVGHWLRSRQIDGGSVPRLDGKTAEALAKRPEFPNLLDQRANLLVELGRRSRGSGTGIGLEKRAFQYIVGASDPNTVSAIFDRLLKEGLARTVRHAGDHHVVALTFDGLLAYEDLARGKSTRRSAFMAMPFNKSDLDGEWLPALKGAVQQTGFTLKRVDDEPRPGLIDIRMQVQIKEARFLIVELTHANNGAYWEAGFATGLGKPVIYTIREGEKPHFDVDHWLRVVWSPTNLRPALDTVKAIIRNELPDAMPEQE